MAERRKGERREGDRRVAGPKIRTTTQEVVNAAKILQWKGPMPEWTSVVEGRELPARLLLLKAAQAADNDPVNSEEAAIILSDLGFEVRYKGTTIPWEDMPA